jgi:DNA invertase Pin-like site-specific DNA recombinase
MTSELGESQGRLGNAAPFRAAQYLRKSTDHQRYSTLNQSDTNHAYAACRGMEIVRTYADEGRSGLTLGGRDALQQLIDDVQSGTPGFDVILCYDVSRWGRFQDADEAAHLEYLCKRAGIAVHYCAEQFVNDGSLFSSLIKNLKRVMAAEYSRELSAKTFAGQRRLARLGYRVGGSAPYGLRRQLVDEHGTLKGMLAHGQHKSISTDRVVLTLGPPRERAVVRSIFESFVAGGNSTRAIAEALNEQGIANVTGRRWTVLCVHRVLSNENYIGTLVWNRESLKLKAKRRRNPADEWVRVEGVEPTLVSRCVFGAAQAKLRDRPQPTQQSRLAPLRRLLRTHGHLSAALIDKAKGVPSASSYGRWFGSLSEAYRLAGYGFHPQARQRKGPPLGTTRSLSNVALLEGLRQVFLRHGTLTQEIVDQSPEIPCGCTYRKRFGTLLRAYEMVGYADKCKRPARTSPAATRALTDRELLQALRRLKARQGRLSLQLIEESAEVPCATTIRRRFGTLAEAYRLVGFSPSTRTTRSPRMARQRRSNAELLNALRDLYRKHGYLSGALIAEARTMSSPNAYVRRFGSLSRAYQLIGFDTETPRKLAARQ